MDACRPRPCHGHPPERRLQDPRMWRKSWDCGVATRRHRRRGGGGLRSSPRSARGTPNGLRVRVVAAGGQGGRRRSRRGTEIRRKKVLVEELQRTLVFFREDKRPAEAERRCAGGDAFLGACQDRGRRRRRRGGGRCQWRRDMAGPGRDESRPRRHGHAQKSVAATTLSPPPCPRWQPLRFLSPQPRRRPTASS